MASVVFSTPGLIPIEAFTTFGMSAKPASTNPFGKFGTGLKIAVAVCLRLGQEVVVWRGAEKYTFYTKIEDFRGKEFQKVKMRKETHRTIGEKLRLSKSYHDLPFTTELGKHWELWQAFREFQTNTMDENGTTEIAEWQDQWAEENTTHIVVTGTRFRDEYFDRGRNFLEDGLTVRTDDARIQVLDKPSKHIYFRGVRVMDLKEESTYTYNFLMDIDLTEDRTAKYPFLLESEIADYIKASEDPAFLHKTVVAPKSQSFEASLGYRYSYGAPSGAFMAAASMSPVVAVKEMVKVAERKADETILRLVVGKALTRDEFVALRETCKELWQSAHLTVESHPNRSELDDPDDFDI